jgi:hypothetical protein
MDREKQIARLTDLIARAEKGDKPLLEQDLDALRAFRPTVKRLGFFESAKPVVSEWGRDLVREFPQETARYVAWHLELEHETRTRPLEITLEWKMILEDGSLFTDQILRTILLPEWPRSWHTASWGWDKAGQWKRGKHKALLTLWDEPIGESSFAIV